MDEVINACVETNKTSLRISVVDEKWAPFKVEACNLNFSAKRERTSGAVNIILPILTTVSRPALEPTQPPIR
jgi:hypothetical protein